MEMMLIAQLTATLIDCLFGDINSRYHPVALMGKYINSFKKRWNRGNSAQQFWSGIALIWLGGVLFAGPMILFQMWLKPLPFWLNGLFAGLLLKPCFAFNALLKAGCEVQVALERDDLPEARRLLGWHLVSRDTSNLSSAQVASGVIESLAENLTDSFLSPMIYFSIGNLPLAWFYRLVNTADAMVAYHTAELEHFGKFTAKLDDILNWIPARLAALSLVLSAGLTHLNMRRAWIVMLAQSGRTSSPNAGWTMAAAAGALETVLEKTETYRLEGGEDLPDSNKINDAIRLLKAAFFINMVLTGGLIVFFSRVF